VRKLLSALALVAAIAAPVALHATPITGQFSIGGTVTNTGSALNFGIGTIFTGTGTQTQVFSILVPDHTPVTMGPTGIVFAPYTCCTVFTVGNLTTTLETLTYNIETVGGVPLYGFGGTALFHDTTGVYTDTMGTFGFSAQQSGPVTFSATGISTASPVPEPSTLALMGSGVLGLAGVVRRKFLA
jgi:hypothetical protein